MAFNVKLVDELTVNGTIAMILITCIASPWIVARWGERLQPVEVAAEAGNLPQPAWGSRVLVPVANPDTESNLLRLALILAKKEGGTLLPLHVLSDRAGSSGPTGAVVDLCRGPGPQRRCSSGSHSAGG
ncbi:hypothetical protein [Synechococcus sp. H70.2]|uniref:hypothetical protein n=1 Tax=unclassified Synechococcus TaxID=2626047 RepID=UPI0039C0A659